MKMRPMRCERAMFYMRVATFEINDQKIRFLVFLSNNEAGYMNRIGSELMGNVCICVCGLTDDKISGENAVANILLLMCRRDK